jgi:large subunit ribosomal protein L23
MNKERLMQVLVGPVVSEKSANMADAANQYAFKVLPDATKSEIAQAVEMMFEVNVEQVRVLNVKGKEKRFGRLMGRRKDERKAYVRLAAGQDIDFTA